MSETPFTPAAPPVKKRVSRLAALVPGAVGPVFSKRGFANADIAVHWPEIVGASVARHTRALTLTWPRGGADSGLGATLTIACSGAFALDLQQMAPVIAERLNQRLGWRCVTKITIKQMPVRPQPAREARRPPAPADISEAGRIATGIHSDSLREAVTRLGAATLARGRRRSMTNP